MNKYYAVYMVQMRETGKPYDTIEFAKVVWAKDKDEAFLNWCIIHDFDHTKFDHTDENIWRNYYPVYVQEL